MAHTDRQTNKHTDGHGDSMTDPAQRAESVKIAWEGDIYIYQGLPVCHKACSGPFSVT